MIKAYLEWEVGIAIFHPDVIPFSIIFIIIMDMVFINEPFIITILSGIENQKLNLGDSLFFNHEFHIKSCIKLNNSDSVNAEHLSITPLSSLSFLYLIFISVSSPCPVVFSI